MASRKLFLAAVFLCLAATAANAYTIVMRNGRRVQIPDQFTITQSTLTYEVGPGIQITFQLAGIDIPATERANGQPYGSFLLKASAPQAVPDTTEKRAVADRSITNQDLEDYRRRRIQSELAYEKRRKQLGLPSPEEQRRQIAAIEERTREQLLNRRSQDQSSEDYWRGRASALRLEIASNQAQTDYVRRRLQEIESAQSSNGFLTTLPFENVLTPNVWPFANPQNRYNRFNRRGRFGRYGRGNVFALPYPQFDYSEERTELTNQLNELEMQRAGFNVRWQALEEEARRAGAYPGWLRP
jgi:hypothetical protein